MYLSNQSRDRCASPCKIALYHLNYIIMIGILKNDLKRAIVSAKDGTLELSFSVGSHFRKKTVKTENTTTEFLFLLFI